MFRFGINLKDAFWWYWIAAFLFFGAGATVGAGKVRVAGVVITRTDEPVGFACVVGALCIAACACLAGGLWARRRARAK